MVVLLLGRSYVITSPKSLSNVLDSLVLKFQMGVVINFEKIGGPDKVPEGIVGFIVFDSLIPRVVLESKQISTKCAK